MMQNGNIFLFKIGIFHHTPVPPQNEINTIKGTVTQDLLTSLCGQSLLPGTLMNSRKEFMDIKCWPFLDF